MLKREENENMMKKWWKLTWIKADSKNVRKNQYLSVITGILPQLASSFGGSDDISTMMWLHLPIVLHYISHGFLINRHLSSSFSASKKSLMLSLSCRLALICHHSLSPSMAATSAIVTSRANSFRWWLYFWFLISDSLFHRHSHQTSKIQLGRSKCDALRW